MPVENNPWSSKPHVADIEAKKMLGKKKISSGDTNKVIFLRNGMYDSVVIKISQVRIHAKLSEISQGRIQTRSYLCKTVDIIEID